MVRKLPVTLFLLLLAASVSVAAEIKVATLNCYLLFDPFTQFQIIRSIIQRPVN